MVRFSEATEKGEELDPHFADRAAYDLSSILFERGHLAAQHLESILEGLRTSIHQQIRCYFESCQNQGALQEYDEKLGAFFEMLMNGKLLSHLKYATDHGEETFQVDLNEDDLPYFQLETNENGHKKLKTAKVRTADDLILFQIQANIMRYMLYKGAINSDIEYVTQRHNEMFRALIEHPENFCAEVSIRDAHHEEFHRHIGDEVSRAIRQKLGPNNGAFAFLLAASNWLI